MNPSPPRPIRDDLREVERRIERLEAELDAARAVRRQLMAEQDLARRFPSGSGLVRE
jgi:hypothetical protein